MVSAQQVRRARELRRMGLDLAQTAYVLCVPSHDLDIALWNHIGIPDAEIWPDKKMLPQPMF